MKRFEGFLWIVVALAFVMRPFVDTSHFIFLAVLLISCSYFVGGYWLFNLEKPRRKLIPILSGFILGPCIYIWPSIIKLNIATPFQLFRIAATGCLALFLLLIIVFSKRLGGIANNIKPLFWRSVVILSITGIFTPQLIYYKPYRILSSALNNGDGNLRSNIEMFDYYDLYKKAQDAGDCDNAIRYALFENLAGRKWLGLDNRSETAALAFDTIALTLDSVSMDDSVKEMLSESGKYANNLQAIGATYDHIWDAYDCKASTAFANQRYDTALKYYLLADKATAEFYQDKNSRSVNYYKIAQCDNKLGYFKKGTDYLTRALEIRMKNGDTASLAVGQIISEMGISCSHMHFYAQSNHLYRIANAIYRKDSTNKDAIDELVSNYTFLSQNLATEDSLDAAFFYIKKAISLEKPGDLRYCISSLYYATYLTKISVYDKTDSVLRESKECLQANHNPYVSLATYDYLASFCHAALAKYELAKNEISEAKTVLKNAGQRSTEQYQSCLLLSADIHHILGEYPDAINDYDAALSMISTRDSSRRMQKALIKSSTAELYLTLDETAEAKIAATEAILLAGSDTGKSQSSNNVLYNKLAYVNYALGNVGRSKMLYEKVLSNNAATNYRYTITSALAYNGLGLDALAEKRLNVADSLFDKSLHMYRRLVHEKNPLTAQVYVNYALLNVAQNKLPEAEEKLHKAQAIDQSFLSPDHDVFGDIAAAMGDIYVREGDKIKAREYYERAINIYKKKFDPGHSKIKNLQRKLL